MVLGISSSSSLPSNSRLPVPRASRRRQRPASNPGGHIIPRSDEWGLEDGLEDGSRDASTASTQSCLVLPRFAKNKGSLQKGELSSRSVSLGGRARGDNFKLSSSDRPPAPRQKNLSLGEVRSEMALPTRNALGRPPTAYRHSKIPAPIRTLQRPGPANQAKGKKQVDSINTSPSTAETSSLLQSSQSSESRSAVVSPDTSPRVPNGISDTTQLKANASYHGPLQALLTLPQPVDRSPRARWKDQNQVATSDKYGLFEGEAEPRGIRGQEAVVTVDAEDDAVEVAMLPGLRTQFQKPQNYQEVEEQSPDHRNTSPRVATEQIETPQQQHQDSGINLITPTGAPPHPDYSPHNSSTSSDSDEDLARMIPLTEWTPSTAPLTPATVTPEGSQQSRTSASGIPRPSASFASLVGSNRDGSQIPSAAKKRILSSSLPPRPKPGPSRVAHQAAQAAMAASSAPPRPPPQPWSTVGKGGGAHPPTGTSWIPKPSVSSRNQWPKTSTTAPTTTGASTRDRERGESGHQEADVSMQRDIDRMNANAMEHVQHGEFEDALTLFTRVLRMHRQRYGDIHPAVASAHHNLGTVHAKRAAQLMTAEDETSGERNDDENAKHRQQVMQQQRHYRAAALQCFQAAARTARDSLGSTHPNVAVSLVRIGFLLLQARQYQHASVTFQEAVRIRVAHFGPQHPLVANLYNNLGVCHMHLGQFDQGRDYLLRALQIQKGVIEVAVDDDDLQQEAALEWADTLFNMGGLHLEAVRQLGPDGRRAIEAEQAFADCYQTRSAILGLQNPSTKQVEELLHLAKSLPRPEARPPKMVVASSKKRSGSHLDAGNRRNEQSFPIDKPDKVNESESLTLSRTESTEVNEPPRVMRWTETESDLAARLAASNEKVDRLVPAGLDADANGARDLATTLTILGPQQITQSKPYVELDTKKAVLMQSPPVLEVSVSNDGPDNDDDGPLLRSSGTRIFVSPLMVPKTSIIHRSLNDSREVVGGSFVDQDVGITADLSAKGNGTIPFVGVSAIAKTYSYDAEENCMISDSKAVDSEQGRIHYPLAWSKAGLRLTSTDQDEDDFDRERYAGRDIVVTRPFRNSELFHPHNARYRSRSKEELNTSWNSETVNILGKTGNLERETLLARAKAILEAHSSMLNERTNESGDRAIDRDEGIGWDESMRRTTNIQPKGKDFSEIASYAYTSVEPEQDISQQHPGALSPESQPDDDMLEDGVAPLGGSWAMSGPACEIKAMVADPMNHLPAIHEEATVQLKRNNFVDAVHLFETVYKCQTRRNGPLHPDVAAALHNVGIAQLRSQNHPEALKAFEEAARIRKGSLGKDHADVAVSLVKAGITQLLLRRFEDALWSFREALSVRIRALGAVHPSTARIYNNIGCVYVEFNEIREARRAFEAALDIQRNALCHDPDSGPLLFATATTLCNLGYLYRYRDMHGQAAMVLKEAADLQKNVLGRSHPTVLSTLDSLADSCANSGQAGQALTYYAMILQRFRGSRRADRKKFRAEAVLLYKMSRIHRHQNDREAQLDKLQLALRSLRSHASSTKVPLPDNLERRIQYDIRECRESMEKEQLQWV